jgi:type IV secretory pathway VirB9-like protein
MKQEEIKQRAYDVYNTWLYSCNDQRESFELMADFATELVAEAEEAAFNAAKEVASSDEGTNYFKYQTVEDWRKER